MKLNINPQIQLLPSALINQIAAGEVVERPASIVKELIENSLDAGATQIDINVKEGGKSFIQITDNGCGMTNENLELSFQRHATSKITTAEDLSHVSSLGFRGEALPSIASVSQLTATSSVDGFEGNEISLSGGSVNYNRPAAGLKGTSIQIKNLFFNIPARRKFLKKTETEFRAIVSIVRQFVLAYPQVGFSFTSNDRKVYQLMGKDLKDRIGDVFGVKFAQSLLPISQEKQNYKVDGYVGNLSLVKKRQGDQYLFLNRRTISDRLLNSAVYSAYRSLIARGEYPFFALNLSVPLDVVDVNVHPAKLEVRFQDEWRIYYVLKSSVSDALKDLLSALPNFTIQTPFAKAPHSPGGETITIPLKQSKPDHTYPIETAPRPDSKNQLSISNGSNEVVPEDKVRRAQQRMENTMSFEKDNVFTTTNIWQIHNKYIVTEVKSGLIIIDQHVAHERILFESAKKAVEHGGLPSQTVLFPQTIKFQPDEYSKFSGIVPYLEKIGFRMREFGENSVVIEGVPPDVYMGAENVIIRDILDKYIEYNEINSSFIEYIIATYACKAAIKAGQKLEPEEMKNLVDKLFATDHPYYCPHGRPIVVNLTTDELDHRFERL